MAFKTVAQFKDSLSGILQGLNLNSVKNLNTALERTARQLAIRLDIPEVVGKTNLTLYDGVTDYTAPSGIFETEMVDVQPQGTSRNSTDYAYKTTFEEFDRVKGLGTTGTKFAFTYLNGTPILRLISNLPTARIDLDSMGATTGWTAAGSASGLAVDRTVFWSNQVALRFLLTGASTGTLTKTISSVDLTNYQSRGMVFLAIRTPSATNLTSITIRLGSSATAYYEVTAATGFTLSFTTNEWMLVGFDLSTATTTGSPTITAINYAQVRIAHAATLTNFYVGDLWISLPSPVTMYYQTNAIFLAAAVGSSPSSSITLDTDSITLNDAALAIYELSAAIEIAQQQGGSLASNMIATLNQELNGVRGYRGILIQPGLLDMYRADNPSQSLRTISSYYD